MGDMRASEYSLWPWPAMLDKGERVKVVMPDNQGTLVVWGVLEESPSKTERVRFKIDTLEPHHVEYRCDDGPTLVLSTYRFDSPKRQIFGGISFSGWFVAELGSKFGLHFDDVAANRDKAAALSVIEEGDGADVTEEPGT